MSDLIPHFVGAFASDAAANAFITSLGVRLIGAGGSTSTMFVRVEGMTYYNTSAKDARRWIGSDSAGAWVTTDPTAGTYVSNTAELQAAVAAGAVKITVGESFTLTADVTLASSTELDFEDGSIVTVPAGRTLTINGVLGAPPIQVFVATGAIALNGPAASCVYPEWFGAQRDNATDDAVAVQAACDSIRTKGGVIRFSAGYYVVGRQIDLDYNMGDQKGIRLTGAGRLTTIIRCAAGFVGNYLFSCDTDAVGNPYRSALEIDHMGLAFWNTSGGGPTEAAIYLKTVRNAAKISDLILYPWLSGFIYGYDRVIGLVVRDCGMWTGTPAAGAPTKPGIKLEGVAPNFCNDILIENVIMEGGNPKIAESPLNLTRCTNTRVCRVFAANYDQPSLVLGSQDVTFDDYATEGAADPSYGGEACGLYVSASGVLPARRVSFIKGSIDTPNKIAYFDDVEACEINCASADVYAKFDTNSQYCIAHVSSQGAAGVVQDLGSDNVISDGYKLVEMRWEGPLTADGADHYLDPAGWTHVHRRMPTYGYIKSFSVSLDGAITSIGDAIDVSLQTGGPTTIDVITIAQGEDPYETETYQNYYAGPPSHILSAGSPLFVIYNLDNGATGATEAVVQVGVMLRQN